MTTNTKSLSKDKHESIVKVAKKILKKKEKGTLKLKALEKKIKKKLADNKLKNISEEEIRQWCSSSSSSNDSHYLDFTIEGKFISLKNNENRGTLKTDDTKRKILDDSEDKPSKDEDVTKKSSKKAKKNKQTNMKKNTSEIPMNDFVSIAKWRTDHKIVIKDTSNDATNDLKINQNPDYFPFSSFDSPECKEKVTPELLHQCTVVNKFTKPSPIQAQCWPVLISSRNNEEGRDVVGIAETGSGKTLAFSIPALTFMHRQNKQESKRRRKPRMLVLAPTRELAMQSHDVLVEFGSIIQIQSLVVYGGVPKHTQQNALRKGMVDCIVATPGRLKDLIQEGTCDLSEISNLVLDEADRMLDMGFEEDVRYIVSQCRSKESRQTCMFSATWPTDIQKIAMEYMRNPMRVYVGFESIVGKDGETNVEDSALSANKRVSQIVEVIEDRARDDRLKELLQKYHGGKHKCQNRVLIFALYKKEAQRLEYSLKRQGWKCCSIHGDKNQEARTKALMEFKNGSNPLMIATDVAARGLDIPNVEVVLNFTFPLTIEDYVHRIGRTGRAGKNGISHTFFQPGDKSHAGELQQVMRQAGQSIPQELMNFGSTIKKKEHKLYGNFGPKSGPMKKAVKIKF